ncbi:MAG: DUF5979 domain-containing protein [Beutenbergiaceae bacterium]
MFASARESANKTHRYLSLAAIVALVGTLVPAITFWDVVQAPPAQAVTIDASVQAQMARESGYTAGGTANPSAGDCVRYGIAAASTSTGVAANTGGSNGTSAAAYSDGNTAWVSDGATLNTAYSAHGNNCTGASTGGVSLNSQSAIGFRPTGADQFSTGTIFNLGRMVHRNHPVNTTNSWFQGDMNIRFDPGDTPVDMTFRWQLHETPNTPGPVNDIVTFLNEETDATFVADDGLTYTMVVRGFTAPQSGTTCAATLTSLTDADIRHQFSTVEGAVNYGCLYASMEQVRTLTIVKDVADPYAAAPATVFDFTSTSSVAGSHWDGAAFSLADADSYSQTFTTAETIRVSEADQASPWTLDGVSCVQGEDTPIPDVGISGGQITIPAGLSTATAADAEITCTYTNAYQPRATLTLVKEVNSTGQPAPTASAYDWTLSASGNSTISGTGQTGPTDATANPAITDQSVIAGSYALTETATGTSTSGYVQDGDWDCVASDDQPVSVTDGNRVDLAHGDDVTCTVTNRFVTGALEITKTVDTTPDGGYTAGDSVSFTAQYACTPGGTGVVTVNPDDTNGQPGAVVIVPDLPSGAQCTVTELSPPTGTSDNLTNASWTWNPPTEPAQVQIPADGAVRVNIGNTATQDTAALMISKTVEPREGTPAAGYTGGTSRPFTVDYSCTIDGEVVASGSVDISTGGPATIPDVPVTAVCTITDEVLSERTGDFADVSYAWDGFSSEPVTVTAAGGQLDVTNHFQRATAELTLAKVVTGDGYAASAADFTIGYDCGDVAGTVDLADGGSQTVAVPAGVECTVVEDPLPAADLLLPGYVWDSPSYAGLTNGSVSVPVGADATVTVTNANRIGFGQLQLTKAIAHFADQVSNGADLFTITVSCDAPAQGETADYTGTFSFDWPDPGVQQTPYLPTGASCVVTETALPTGNANLPPTSYQWSEAPSAQNATIPASTTPTTITVTNDITRVYAPFSITKDVVNNTDATSPAFNGTFECSYGGVTGVSGTWTAPAAGGAATLTVAGASAGSVDVLEGSSCTVTETDPANPVDPPDPSYTWAQDIPGAITVPQAGATATVRNTLNRATGSVNISKSVTGGEAGTAFIDEDFTFSYTCTPVSGPEISGSIGVSAGGVGGIPQVIPGGSSCVVSESATAAAINPYTWDGVTMDVAGADQSSSSSITFTTPANGDPVTVAVTNTISRKQVQVSVVKVVDDPDGGFTGGSDAIFPVTLTCDGRNLGEQFVADGGSASWDVDLGATCLATEAQIAGGLLDSSFGWNEPAVTPTSIDVTGVDGSYTMEITNTIHRVYGAVSLVKIFDDGGYPDVVATATSYGGTWSCSYGTGATAVEVGGDWTGTGSATGDSATLSGDDPAQVLLGSSCTATENDPAAPSSDPSYAWLPVAITGIDSVSSDVTQNVVSVQNTLTRNTGSIAVTKDIYGDSSGYAPAADFEGFEIGVICRFGDQQMTDTALVLPSADAVTLISGVPAGWACQVNEAVPTGQLADASYTWQSPDYDPAAPVTVVAGQTHTVTVTNSIERVFGTITIAKVFADDVPDGVIDDDAEFSGSYTCVYNEGEAGEASYSGTWTVTGEGGASLTGQTQIPLTARCQVTEDSPDPADLRDISWAWATPVLSGPAEVTSAETPAMLSVTNSVERVWAGLSITKHYTGVGGAFADTATVGGTWECSDDGAALASGRWELPASGGTVVVAAVADQVIPAGATCVVAEDTLDDSMLTDASYAWNEPVFQPATASVRPTANQVGEVTVTNSTERVFTGFAITKSFTATAPATDAHIDPGMQFSGEYSCQYGTDDPVTGSWGPIGGGETFVVSGILAGSQCQVISETRPDDPVIGDPSISWLPVDLGQPLTTPAADGELPQITVRNIITRSVGSFSVSKIVTGATSGQVPGSQYQFAWQCTAPNGDQFPGTEPGRFVLTDGQSLQAVSSHIPVGSSCTVTELDPPLRTHPSYTWATTMSVVGASGTVAGSSITFTVPADGVVAVSAENSLTREPGSYSVAKTSDPATGSPVEPGDTISYTVAITAGEAGFVDDVVVTDDMSQVLQYADLDGASVIASKGTVTLDETDLVWEVGRVEAGTPLTLTYQVRVRQDAFGVTIRNAVTVDGELPPTECEPCTTSHPTTPTPPLVGPPPSVTTPPAGALPPSARMPQTGIGLGSGLAWTAGLLLLGSVLVIVRRRRNRSV